MRSFYQGLKRAPLAPLSRFSSTQDHSIPILVRDPLNPKPEEHALSNRLKAPLFTEDTFFDVNPSLYLSYEYPEGRGSPTLSIHAVQNTNPKKGKWKAMSSYVDLVQMERTRGRPDDMLLKACGSKPPNGCVWDCTAGYGVDSLILSVKFPYVVMFERHPIIFELLSNGLERSRQSLRNMDTCLFNMNAHHIDQNFISTLPPTHQQPAVIYLDPMFPPKRKGGIAGRNMQIFHHLFDSIPLEFEDDDESLLLKALEITQYRVVMKRPRHSPPVSEQVRPSVVLEGRSSRYDIFQV